MEGDWALEDQKQQVVDIGTKKEGFEVDSRQGDWPTADDRQAEDIGQQGAESPQSLEILEGNERPQTMEKVIVTFI